MKKISLFLATLFVLTLFLPSVAFAEGLDILAFNYNGLVSSAAVAGETYASGKNPSNKGASTVDLRLSFIKNTSITGNILLTPVVDGNYPFVANSVAKSIDIAAADWFADFSFALKGNTYNGTYPVVFQASFKYDDGGTTASGNQFFTVYVDVTGREAPVEPSPSPSPSSGSQPRVMVTKYATDPATVVAGGNFSITVEFTNESKTEKVQNVKITLSNPGGEFLPTDGTNAAYVAGIGAGKSVEKTFHYSVNPEAQPKPATFSVDIAYENKDAVPLTESASISIPVTQPIRIKIDDPQLYDTAVGEPIYISLNVYNLGKSALYNLMATVEGEGLSVEQSYYGGNIEAGGTKTVELSVVADISSYITGENTGEVLPEDGAADGGVSILPYGVSAKAVASEDSKANYEGKPVDGSIITGSVQVSGQVKLTYEDAQGTQYTEYKDFVATVLTQTDPGFEPEVPVEEPATQGANLTWLWVALGVAVMAGGVVVIVLYKRRKKKAIEDELI